jgi:hypothetical protein
VTINFRPHHFLCALCFQGRGYSPAFVTNFIAIMSILNGAEGDTTHIQIVKQTDSICDPCPNRKNTACQTEEKITLLDDAHAGVLEINPDTHITWGEAKNKIAQKLTLEKFHRICATCQWKPLGICENVLREFLDKK